MLAALFACSLFAGSNGLYCGIIQGKTALPIVFDLLGHKYFYRKHKKVIPLKVMSESKDKLVAIEGPQGREAQFHLSKFHCPPEEQNCVGLSGFWQEGDKKYPVILSMIDGENDLSFEDLLAGIKTHVKSKGSTKIQGGPKTLKNMDFVYSILNFKDPNKIPALNELINYQNYDDPEEPCDDIITSAYYTQEHNFDLITENLLFIEKRMTGSDPWHPYPLNNEGEKRYYDLGNQRELDLEYVFVDFKKNHKAILGIFFEDIVKKANLIAQKIKQNDKHVEIEDDCWEEYVDLPTPDSFGSFEFHLDTANRRLGLGRSFPHVLNVCNNNYQYVDTHIFEKYLNKKTELYDYLLFQKLESHEKHSSWWSKFFVKAFEFYQRILSFMCSF
jgi:hypothetical protein